VLDRLIMPVSAMKVLGTTGERVHVDPDLLVYEVDVLSDDVIKAFVHDISRAQRSERAARRGDMLPQD